MTTLSITLATVQPTPGGGFKVIRLTPGAVDNGVVRDGQVVLGGSFIISGANTLGSAGDLTRLKETLTW